MSGVQIIDHGYWIDGYYLGDTASQFLGFCDVMIFTSHNKHSISRCKTCSIIDRIFHQPYETNSS